MPQVVIGPVVAYEAAPESPSVSITGSDSTVWVDENEATYVSQTETWDNGTIPTGIPFAGLGGLPLTTEEAAGVEKAYITWTAWYSGTLPPPDNEGNLGYLYVVPKIALGRGADIGHFLGPRAIYSWDTESLHLSTSPQTFTREVLFDGGVQTWKSLADVLTANNLYVPPEALDPETFHLRFETTRWSNDIWVDGQNTGPQTVVHISEVQIVLGEPGPAPLEVDPGVTTMRLSFVPPPAAEAVEVRIGDPITVQGETPIALAGDAGEFTFEGLAPLTSFRVGVRSFMFDTPSAWEEADSMTLSQSSEPEPGLTHRPHYHRYVRNGTGDVRPGVSVALFEPGTEDPIAQSVYVTATGSTEHGTEWVSISGVVDFYLDTPAVVDIRITPAGGEAPVTFANQWVGNPGGGGGGGGGAVTSVNGMFGDVTLAASDVGAVPTTFDLGQIQIIDTFAYDALIDKDPYTLYLVYGGAV